MGLIPQLTVVLVYFLISRCWKGHKWILLTVFPVSAAVFLLGYINRFGIYPIEMAYANPSFISTIGNMNWYCGYLMCVFFGGVCLLWRSDGDAKNVQNGKKIPNTKKRLSAGWLVRWFDVIRKREVSARSAVSAADFRWQ